jgi:hypothetical protein
LIDLTDRLNRENRYKSHKEIGELWTSFSAPWVFRDIC